MGTRLMWIVWPAFLAACALELLVFAFVDPLEMQWGGQNLGWPRQSVYTLFFFAFWAISMAACFLTTLLRKTAAELNQCPYPASQRPAGCPADTEAQVS